MKPVKKRWKVEAKGVKVDVIVDIGKAIDGWTWGDAITTSALLMSIARDILLNEVPPPPGSGGEP